MQLFTKGFGSGTTVLTILNEEMKDILNGTRWVPAYVIGDNVTYFDSFGFEYIPKEIKIFTSKRNIINIYRIQAKDSIICGYFCIRFIDFMLKVKVC